MLSLATVAFLPRLASYEEKPHEEEKVYVSGIIIPNYSTATDTRAKLFAELVPKIKQPKTIILISPNHLNVGTGKIQITDKVWNTNLGEIQPDQAVITSLVQLGAATHEPESFANDDGIQSLLQNIHAYFPNATIVPIMLKQVSEDGIEKLNTTLSITCTDCIMIASTDLSQHQPALLANLHDERSIRDLESLNTPGLLEDEVDSPASLALLSLWAKKHGTKHFTLYDHTNSDILNQEPDSEASSHVFGWYTEGEWVAPERSVSFIFGGDMMFARLVQGRYGDDFPKAFENLGDRVFWGTDASIANFEGTITANPVDSLNSPEYKLVFQFYPSVISALQYLHINGVSLANNHSDNAGRLSASNTRGLLRAAHIQPFGDSVATGTISVAKFQGHGLTLAVVGINLTYPGQTGDDIVPLITELTQDPNVRVIIMPHWGVEYFQSHTAEQARIAHAWIDAGAHMVIGSHPHVVEDSELYKNAPIIYSLGNFLFDQDFSKATQEGLFIAGSFTDKGLAFFGLPTQSENLQPQLLEGERKDQILNDLYMPFKAFITNTPAGTFIKVQD